MDVCVDLTMDPALFYLHYKPILCLTWSCVLFCSMDGSNALGGEVHIGHATRLCLDGVRADVGLSSAYVVGADRSVWDMAHAEGALYDSIICIRDDLLLGGAILASITLILTLDALWNDPLGGTENNVVFNTRNLLYFPEFLGRYFAMGTIEIARYTSHIELLFQQIDVQPWAVPSAVVLIIASALQVVFLVYFLLLNRDKEAQTIKRLLLISAAIVFASFLFSIKPPISYTFYFTFPLILTLSLSAYAFYIDRWRLKEWFSWIFMLSILFHLTHMLFGFNFKSIYIDRTGPAWPSNIRSTS